MKIDKNYKMKKELKTILAGISDPQERSHFKKVMMDAEVWSVKSLEKNKEKSAKKE